MSQQKLAIGDRMKRYEAVSSFNLSRRIPVILRLDGRAFHTVTRKRFGKHWNQDFVDLMIQTAQSVYNDIQGCSIAYSQSDEISFLLTDYRTIATEPWFNYDINKMVSISASLASVAFSKLSGVDVCFDARVFSLSQDEVCNYFIWRQQDATRNAIQMAGREYYSHNDLNKKNCNAIPNERLLYGVNHKTNNEILMLRNDIYNVTNHICKTDPTQKVLDSWQRIKTDLMKLDITPDNKSMQKRIKL